MQHQEGGRQTHQRDGSTEAQQWVFGGASKFGEGNCFPLGFRLGDGRGRWRLPAPLFAAELNSFFRAQQLSLLVSSSPPALQAELLTFNIPYVKSH